MTGSTRTLRLTSPGKPGQPLDAEAAIPGIRLLTAPGGPVVHLPETV